MKFFNKTNLLKGTLGFGILSLSSIALVSAAAINRELQIGMSGSDVGVMQTFFKQDASIYPEGLVTNYFGGMTRAAVRNFQARNGIATVGRVGPQTLPVLNAAIANNSLGNGNNNNNNGNTGNFGVAPTISGVNVSTSGASNSVNLSWSTNELAKGFIYYSTSPLNTYENENSVTVTGANTASVSNNFVSSQTVSLQNLQANTTYYYMIYVTDQSGNVSVYQSIFRIN
jgi:peptidoglycan hydrolase-like protein with peptidoglycan-binding domain